MVSLQGNRVVAESPIMAVSSELDDDVVLSVKGVSKKFCRDLKRSLLYGIQDIASEMVGIRGTRDELRRKEFWALDDISFELRRGEALGLVGKNGSGKSTLLRIIAGLIKPDAGTVEISGRVAPLIALGAGFNPILTGRENIYANMSILGLSKAEIDERFADVVEFAEIGDAIDSPVQSYSSGMAARLGFASAIHTEPEILLIDEVLAVGDSRFRGKCFQKLHNLRQKGTAFILVSHSSHLIMTVCKTALYVSKGEFKGFGIAQDIVAQYDRDLFSGNVDDSNLHRSQNQHSQALDLPVSITGINFRDQYQNPIDFPQTGETLILSVNCVSSQSFPNISVTVSVRKLADGGEISLIMNCIQDGNSISLENGINEIQLQLDDLGLQMGDYLLDVYLKQDGLYHLDSWEEFRFKVKSEKPSNESLYYQKRTWTATSKVHEG